MGVKITFYRWITDIITFSSLLSDFRCFNGQILLGDINYSSYLRLPEASEGEALKASVDKRIKHTVKAEPRIALAVAVTQYYEGLKNDQSFDSKSA